jgi:hypothetical protein
LRTGTPTGSIAMSWEAESFASNWIDVGGTPSVC